MHFDENLFYDFQINEKLKKPKPSYEVKSQEVGVSIRLLPKT